jgi:hypothetical protein
MAERIKLAATALPSLPKIASGGGLTANTIEAAIFQKELLQPIYFGQAFPICRTGSQTYKIVCLDWQISLTVRLP